MGQQLLLTTIVAATLVFAASADGSAPEQQVSVADDECPFANADECSLNALKATTLQPEDDAQASKVDEGDEEVGGDQREDDGALTPKVDGGEAEGGGDQPEDDTPALKVDGGDVEGGGRQPEYDDAQILKVDDGDEEGGRDQQEDDGASTLKVDGGEAEGGGDQPEVDDTPALNVDGGDVEGGGPQPEYDDASALKVDGGDAEGGGEQLEDDDALALKVDGGNAEGGGIPKADSVSKEDKGKPGAFDFAMANCAHLMKMILYWCKVAVVTVFSIPLFVLRDVGTPINTIVMVWGASLTSMAVWWVVIKRSASSGGGSATVFVEKHQLEELKGQLAVMQEKLNTLQSNQSSMPRDKMVAQVSKELTEEEIYVISKNIRQELRIYVHSLFNSIKPSKKYCEEWGIDHKLPEKLVQMANELDGRSFPADRNLYPKPEHLGGPKNTNPNAAFPAWKKEAAEWHRTHQPRPRPIAPLPPAVETADLKSPIAPVPPAVEAADLKSQPKQVGEQMVSGTSLGEQMASATQPKQVGEQMAAGTSLVEQMASATQPKQVGEQMASDTSLGEQMAFDTSLGEQMAFAARHQQRVPFNPGPPPPTNPFAAAAAMKQKNEVSFKTGPPPPTNPFAAAAAMKQKSGAAEVPRDLSGLATGTPARPELDI